MLSRIPPVPWEPSGPWFRTSERNPERSSLELRHPVDITILEAIRNHYAPNIVHSIRFDGHNYYRRRLLARLLACRDE